MLARVCIIVALCGCGRINFDSDLVCPAGFLAVNASCYRVDTTNDTDWISAERACEKDPGAHLAAIEDAVELDTVDALVPVNDAWIGTSDRIVPETYLTVTGQRAYVQWDTGQPNDAGGPEYCVLLVGAVMHDEDCVVINDFVCEYEGEPIDPSAF